MPIVAILRSIAALSAVLAAYLVVAEPSSAGTLTLNIDATHGCGLFTAVRNTDKFVTLPPCSGGNNFGFGYIRAVSVPYGYGIGLQTSAPAGITINSAYVTPSNVNNFNDGEGWGGGGYWATGASLWPSQFIATTDGPFSSSYWGFQMLCGWTSCSNPGSLLLNSVRLTATEDTGPSINPVGSNNVWFESAHWVWNAPGDVWPISFASSDLTGVCSMWATVDRVNIPGPSAAPDTSLWQQCPNQVWTASEGAMIDTHDFVVGDGLLPLQLGASNAAGVTSHINETLSVDNDPVGVSFTTPDDANPSAWVGHPVTVNATATAGPSHVGGMNCGVDGAAEQAYPSGGIAVDGDGVHNVSCTAFNNALNPEGAHATGSASLAVHIDEAPPSLGFEPQSPAAPAHLTVDVADPESGVASGSIQMAPAGTSNWTSLPTGFDGQHLLADIDDAGRSGAYTLRASACDNVGNCASTDENVRLPLRLAASSDVSFTKIEAPAVTVSRRVLVGGHYRIVRRHGTLHRVRTGGHYVTVRIVIGKNAACSRTRIRTGPHRWREISACRRVKVKTLSSELVGFGKRATVHGLLVTADGLPIANAPVQVLAAPDNGLSRFAPLSMARTDGRGRWSATLPPGPSRIVRAVYGGSSVLLPATGTVHTIVPAKIRLISVAPSRIPWGGTVRIVGQLEGGYLPPGGALVRLRIGAGRAVTTYGVKTHVTGSGRFSTTYTFGLGDPSLYQAYWFQVASLPMGNYPFAPADSGRMSVVVGGHPARR